MIQLRHTRRDFLRYGTAGAAALGLGPRPARAATRPKRIIFCVQMHGFVHHDLQMIPAGKAAGDAFEFDLDAGALSPTLQPLAPWANRLLVLDGISMNSAIGGYWTARNPHVPGHIHLLTGANTAELDEDGAASAPSVDQIIAARLEGPLFGSVEVGFGTDGGLGLGAYNWSGPSTSLPYVYEPAALYDLLFSDLDTGATVGGLAAWRERLARFATDEHAALLERHTGVSADRLTAHRDLLAELAERFAGLGGLACTAPQRPGPSTTYAQRYADYGAVIAAAFGCDLTRVATIAFEDQDAADCGGTPGASLHNDYAHDTTERNGMGGSEFADSVMSQASRNHAGHIASLLAALEAVQEEDGSTLLDHTLVVWTSEIACGRHEGTRAYSDLPFILAGGEGFRMGRYVSYAEDQAPPMSDSPLVPAAVGPSHNHLLVSLCREMGLEDVDAVGVESLMLEDGSQLDCTGELDGLT